MMKFRKFTLILLFLLIATITMAHQYAPDIIVTSPAGLWTDTRAYVTLADALTAIGADERNLYIVRQEDYTGTIPATASLNFMRVGSINATGAVTINSKSIIAGNRRIFFGAGALTFADGSVLKSAWFDDIDEAIAETNTDTVTILMTQAETAATTAALGNDVTLKWDAPGNALSINAGRIISNISSIIAGDFEILTGAGRADFIDGSTVWSTWFDQLRTAGRHIDDSRVVLEVRKEETLDYDYTFGTDIRLDFRSRLTIPNGRTLTIYSPSHVIADSRYFIFNTTGTGTVAFTASGSVYPNWWGALPDGATDNTAAFRSAVATNATVLVPEGASFYKITEAVIQTSTTGDVSIIGIGKPEIKLVRTPYGEARADNSFCLVTSNLNDLTLKNLKLTGNWDETEPGVGEKGQGVNIAQIGGKAIIDNIEVNHWIEYGLETWDSLTSIGYIDANNNGYQGIAIVNNSKQIDIDFAETYENGHAGLDIEYAARPVGIKNIHVKTLWTYDNGYYGLNIAGATDAQMTAQGLTLDDFDNIVFDSVSAHGNGDAGTYSGVRIAFPNVFIGAINSHDNTDRGLYIYNPFNIQVKGLDFGHVEVYGNTTSGIEIAGSTTYPWNWITFRSIYSHNNEFYGIRTQGATSQVIRYLDLGVYHLANNTTAEFFGILPFYGDYKDIGWGIGMPTINRVYNFSEVRQPLTDDGVTNIELRVPLGARVTGIWVQVDTIDGGASAEFRVGINKMDNGFTDLGDIDVSAAGATGLRVFRPDENRLDAADDDTAVMGHWLTDDEKEWVRLIPIGTWTTGNAVGIVVVEFAW